MLTETTGLYREECSQIINHVFTTMLNLPPRPATEATHATGKSLTAAVYFAGSWQGACLLECTERDACTFAERLMSLPRPEVCDDDVRDSLREIVNMVGGNLKALLPSGVAVSMPSVIEGTQYSLKLSATVITRQSFYCADDPIYVTLLEMPVSHRA